MIKKNKSEGQRDIDNYEHGGEDVVVRLFTMSKMNSKSLPSHHFESNLSLLIGGLVGMLKLRSKPILLNKFDHLIIYVNLFLLCMTRSDFGNLHAYDPKIDRTLYRLRNSGSNEVVNNSSLNCSVFASDCVGSSFASDSANNIDSNSDLGIFGTGSASNFGVSISLFGLYNVENNDRTLKELTTPDVMYQPWCIQYPELEQAQSYELKSRLIHLLPKFYCLVGEDPYKHLKEFHVVCSTMRPNGIPEDYTKMKAFPFSLDGVAKDWL
ncbi:hypothetical protein CR513_41130, partial [Mucuna pruriens]